MGQAKLTKYEKCFGKWRGRRKRKIRKITEGRREEDGGGVKRKRMGEDQSEKGSGKNEKIRKIKNEKGVKAKAEKISSGLGGLRV